jgi:hypothetical protein
LTTPMGPIALIGDPTWFFFWITVVNPSKIVNPLYPQMRRATGK